LTAFANSSTAVLVAAAVAAAFALAGAVLALWALARKDGTIPAALALCVVVGAVMIRFARALQP
jgi:CHASE2 domain-containing sensor protein